MKPRQKPNSKVIYGIGDLSRFWRTWLDQFGLLAPKGPLHY